MIRKVLAFPFKVMWLTFGLLAFGSLAAFSAILGKEDKFDKLLDAMEKMMDDQK